MITAVLCIIREASTEKIRRKAEPLNQTTRNFIRTAGATQLANTDNTQEEAVHGKQ